TTTGLLAATRSAESAAARSAAARSTATRPATARPAAARSAEGTTTLEATAAEGETATLSRIEEAWRLHERRRLAATGLRSRCAGRLRSQAAAEAGGSRLHLF